MRNIFFPLFAVGTLTATIMAQNPVIPAIMPNEKIELQVEELLKKMTLEEKIGQMTELTIDLLQKRTNPFAGLNPQQINVNDLNKILKKYNIEDEFNLSDDNVSPQDMMAVYMRIQDLEKAKGFAIDEAILDSVICKYKVGSILNAPGSEAPTLEQWSAIIGKIQEKSMKEIGIPCIYGLDQNHGTTYTQGGTLFPQNINMAATFNREVAYNAARVTAYETRASSCPWTYSPTIDLGRDPRWARIWENYGEDCYLSGEIGSAAVRGFQGNDPNNIGQDRIAVSLKHYMGYGMPVTGKDRTPAIISPQQLREKHFAPFLACIRNGALSVMVNSGSVNGMPVHASYDLLTQWLKDDLNWDGVIVTDWADINNLFQREKVAANKKEAIKLAINAGIDMSMDPYSWDFCTLLKELVVEGEVPISRIDDATRRVLRMKYRLGLFDKPTQKISDYPLFGSSEHARVALQAAEESMVLLKNTDAILPLSQGKKILVTGPNANSMRCLNGGWSYTWQGHKTNDYTEQYNTIFEALSERFGNQNVVCEQGVSYNESGAYWEENIPEIEKAVAAANNVDYIIACVGENSYCETPGNLTDLTLSENQRNLVKALAATGKPVILILNEGRPRLIADIEPVSDAVVNILLPGNSGGDALARLLAGDVNFSGKLPYTYPKEINSLANYDYKTSEEVNTMAGNYNYDAKVSLQWPFGYGLSYTDFIYSDLKVDSHNFTAQDTIRVSVNVKNNGTKAGKESVLLYSSDLLASLVPDNRRLRGFEKISLQPGELKTVTFTIPASNLAFVGYDGKWVLEKGAFKIQVGNQVVNIDCMDTTRWDTPNI